MDLQFITDALIRKGKCCKSSRIRTTLHLLKKRKVKAPKSHVIAHALESVQSLVSQILNGYRKAKVVRKKSMHLSYGEEETIIGEIRTLKEKRKKVTPKKLRQMATEKSGKVPGNSFHNSFLKRHWRSISLVETKPREESRMKVNIDDIDRYHSLLCDHVVGIRADLVFNADESSYHSYQDTRTTTEIVLNDQTSDQCHTPVDRSEKRL